MKNLPKKVHEKLIGIGLDKAAEIKAFSQTDMTDGCQFADGFLVLSEEDLFVVTSLPDETAVHSFKGYLSKNEVMAEPDHDWFARRIARSEIKKLSMEALISCSILVAEKEDGSEETLAAFSNFCRKDIKSFIKAFDGKEEEKNDSEEFCPTCGMMYPDRERKVCPRCIDKRTVFFRVFRYFKPFTGKIIVMLISYVLLAGVNLIWPYLNGTVLYDKVLNKDLSFLESIGIHNGDFVFALLMVVLTMFVARLVSLLISMLQMVFAAQIVTAVVRDFKKDIFNAMGKLSISFFRSRQTGSLMTRVLGDAERVTGFFLDGLPWIFIHSMTIIATFIMMVRIRWQMAILAVLFMGGASVFAFYMRPMLWNLFGRRHRAERSVNSQVNDNLTGARVVKAFGQEKRENERFSKNNERLLNADMGIIRYNTFFTLMYQFAHRFSTISAWFLGVYFILVKQNMELGLLITFTGYIDNLSGPINFMSHIFHWWADSMNSAQRMFEILDAVPEVQEAENPVALKNPEGMIELKDVTFGYEVNRTILKNISLKIEAGKMLGIVGRSGAGKTTLVNLISRLYDPQEGEILIDGINIKNLAFEDLRRNVAMVSQETYIFMGTVEENIAYANPNASKEDIVRAAKLASAHEFIMRMPDGYNTLVGSSGRDLSGGEKQRISIARAILSNPKILILDEATASVDTETEREIQKSLNYLVKGRTTISIAHRLSTLRDADYLIVLDNGEITEQGVHDELFEKKGTFYKLMELQTKALALKD